MTVSCQQCRQQLGEVLEQELRSERGLPTPDFADNAISIASPDDEADSENAVALNDVLHHLESCIECRRELAQMRQIHHSVATLPLQKVPDELRARIRAQLASEAQNSAVPAAISTVAATSNRTQNALSWRERLTAWWRPANLAWAGSGLALAALCLMAATRQAPPTHSTLVVTDSAPNGVSEPADSPNSNSEKVAPPVTRNQQKVQRPTPKILRAPGKDVPVAPQDKIAKSNSGAANVTAPNRSARDNNTPPDFPPPTTEQPRVSPPVIISKPSQGEVTRNRATPNISSTAAVKQSAAPTAPKQPARTLDDGVAISLNLEPLRVVAPPSMPARKANLTVARSRVESRSILRDDTTANSTATAAADARANVESNAGGTFAPNEERVTALESRPSVAMSAPQTAPAPAANAPLVKEPDAASDSNNAATGARGTAESGMAAARTKSGALASRPKVEPDAALGGAPSATSTDQTLAASPTRRVIVTLTPQRDFNGVALRAKINGAWQITGNTSDKNGAWREVWRGDARAGRIITVAVELQPTNLDTSATAHNATPRQTFLEVELFSLTATQSRIASQRIAVPTQP